MKKGFVKQRIIMQFLLLLTMSCFIFCRQNVSAASAKNRIISNSNKVVVIRTSYATGGFNDGWGGVMEAVPNKDSDVYELYDVVIWDDRISLYKFPGNIDDASDEFFKNHPEYDTRNNKEYEKGWRAFREECCLDTHMVKSSEASPGTNSKKRLSAYKSFFKKIKERTSNSSSYIIKYSGHGQDEMFCGNLNRNDTINILKFSKKLFGKKFSIIDYGTNCKSGKTSVLKMYQDYTDYMIVNQLDFGGFEYDDDKDCKIYDQVDTDMVYDKMFVSGETMKDAAIRMAKQHTIIWPYAKNDLKKHHNPQSVTVVDMNAFKKLMKSASAYISKGSDLKSSIKKSGNKSLSKKYNKAVIFYGNDKKQIGKWSNSYGNGITND
ncbi:hypothetical protein SAMN04487770_12121 [Butyrivibrio sp. ob235]|uniref:hypothetical protein n=2 Tax=unclassified Butyrivibrio TaxID=2639466 RepID=UPI0008D87A7D|nr:hypothetical protein [Butyrivibrio sp. ob235]SEL92868.1 hypothetical protein SAMN04487770_12121 [Butyrivibrio sp. ob235]